MPARPGERKAQILETLAELLEHPRGEKITTALLAARLKVSEAALYRHYASKAQMYEGLIEFIESTLFGLITRISAEESSGLRQAEKMVRVLLAFAEKNKGMTRVLIGDALINEDDRLQVRITQMHDRIEASLRQCLRMAHTQQEIHGSPDLSGWANLLLCFVIGRWHQFARSGFVRAPGDQWNEQLPLLLAPPAPPPEDLPGHVKSAA